MFRELNIPRDKKLFSNRRKQQIYITQYATWHLLSNRFSISCSHFIKLKLFEGLSRAGQERYFSFFPLYASSDFFFVCVCFNKKCPAITAVNFWKKKSPKQNQLFEQWEAHKTKLTQTLLISIYFFEKTFSKQTLFFFLL